ncbi:T9SS type B sorting domain-containing protein [Flavobacterium sp. ASW18X]|uniref:T9SS type B sorting domain-containing protein n=1 Tax=Flavobacterium sp. ASW18X TaxID=2572595 RepID=UPI0010AEC4E6|nr:T9SS type B sorting domain-containing protein [Flavobacterium sp. ASW18X]TKD61781.1 T9SS type B sorting domain-containing protein [Flavobacterium sp. ASW18X]
MRTLLIVFTFLLGTTFLVRAQNSADCRTAIPVCADAPIIGIAEGSGDIDEFDPDVIRETGCLEKGSNSSANIENNTSWFVFRAGTDGRIGFDIEALPANGNTAITAEWDFALYGPFDEEDNINYCGVIGDGSMQPIRCNYEVNDTQFTGVGVNPENGQAGAPALASNNNTYDEWLDVVAGEIYYLFINNYNTNFDNEPESYVLTFTGESVDENQDTSLDCTLRDEFLGFDIIACEGDPDITLSALNSPAGSGIVSVDWSVDYDDDGTIDTTLVGTGDFGGELVVSSPDSGRYFATITNSSNQTYSDDILITFYPTPALQEVLIIEDLSNANDPDKYAVEIVVDGTGDYKYAINGGEFQDSPVFLDVPPGENTIIINDKNGCGTTEPLPFLVIGYPKFFTPNGDFAHDTWMVLGMSQLDSAVLYIFDRYGKLLKQLGPADAGWDGTFNGRPLPSSDYWFKLEYNQNEESVLVAKTVRNHFSLLR